MAHQAELDRVETKKRKQANQIIQISRPLYAQMSSHIMRRSGITYLLEQGVPVTTIMKMSGHEDVSTLMKYENTSTEAVEEALASISIV